MVVIQGRAVRFFFPGALGLQPAMEINCEKFQQFCETSVVTGILAGVSHPSTHIPFCNNRVFGVRHGSGKTAIFERQRSYWRDPSLTSMIMGVFKGRE